MSAPRLRSAGGPTTRASLRDATCVASGTWMGAARSGRFGIVTNFRELERPATDAPSRGDLVTRYLAGDDARRRNTSTNCAPRVALCRLQPVARRTALALLLLESQRVRSRDRSSAASTGSAITGSIPVAQAAAHARGWRNCWRPRRRTGRHCSRCSPTAHRPTSTRRRTPACRPSGNALCPRLSSCMNAMARAARRCCWSNTTAAPRCASAASTQAGARPVRRGSNSQSARRCPHDAATSAHGHARAG